MHTDPIHTCKACSEAIAKLRCNCGAAEQGHSPDCEYVRKSDDIQADHEDGIYQQEDN